MIETVVGQDPRQQALELLDGGWATRLAEAEQDGGADKLAETQLAAAQITALIYVGDEIRKLRLKERTERR